MRLLLVGAFPFPLAQGSQVYLQEQARALHEAGDEVTILSWGRRDAPARLPGVLAEIQHLTAPDWCVPRRVRSGPAPGRVLADLGLASTLRHHLASTEADRGYDAILTHNAEACVISILMRHTLRQRPRPALVYCLHTLLGEELSTYLSSSFERRILTPEQRRTGLRRAADRIGGWIDRGVARRVDGWIALTHSAERVMRSHSVAPGAIVPPPLTDPLGDPTLTPEILDAEATLGRLGLEARSYLLYSGNLDGYQELGILGSAAARLATEGEAPRIVIATHDERAERLAGLAPPGLEVHRIASAAEMQALVVGARASLIMRRSEGGFPIKLVNSLAVGTAPIVFQAREWGLEHGRNAWVASAGDPVGSLCEAIRTLARDDGLVDRLGHGARALYLAEHRPKIAAARTRDLVGRVLDARR